MVAYCMICEGIIRRDDFDRKKPPPPGGFPIYHVPSPRTVCKRTPLEEPGTNPSRGVLLHTALDREHSSAVCCSVLQCVAVCCSVLRLLIGNIVSTKPPREGGVLPITFAKSLQIMYFSGRDDSEDLICDEDIESVCDT